MRRERNQSEQRENHTGSQASYWLAGPARPPARRRARARGLCVCVAHQRRHTTQEIKAYVKRISASPAFLDPTSHSTSCFRFYVCERQDQGAALIDCVVHDCVASIANWLKSEMSFCEKQDFARRTLHRANS